jgi:hypothetical protein
MAREAQPQPQQSRITATEKRGSSRPVRRQRKPSKVATYLVLSRLGWCGCGRLWENVVARSERRAVLLPIAGPVRTGLSVEPVAGMLRVAMRHVLRRRVGRVLSVGVGRTRGGDGRIYGSNSGVRLAAIHLVLLGTQVCEAAPIVLLLMVLMMLVQQGRERASRRLRHTSAAAAVVARGVV